MATIIVFAAASFLAAILVFFKAIELRTGKRNPILGLLGKLDPKSEKMFSLIRYRCLQTVQTARYIVLVKSKELAQDILKKAEEMMVSEYRARHDILMGHKELAHSGSASFYLKKITEHKVSAEKGKIEDRLESYSD